MFCCLVVAISEGRVRTKNEQRDSVPAGTPTFGPGECPPIVVGRTTFNNGFCNGVNCNYNVPVVGSLTGATYTKIQNNCFN